MTTRLAAAENAIAEFLRDKLPDGVALDPDLDLIDERVVDSLGFMDFILLIEELIGTPIPVDSIRIDDFRTLGRIRDKYLSRLGGPVLELVGGADVRG